MKVFADLHLHTKWARATSKDMDIENLAKFAKVKGLNLLGSGDFTHPRQLADIKAKLEPIEGKGLYQYNGMNFMLTTEVATFYFQDKKPRKVHHIIHLPEIEMIDQVIDVFSKKGGNTGIDGRLSIKLTSVEMVEILNSISKDIHIVSAHAWTPWYGVIGSDTGFNSIQECYQEKTKHIYAIETGLSSDPPMNWRVSALDDFALMSNSDAHSPWSWRLGRECNVFDLKELDYFDIWDAIRKKDKKRFLYTIEVDPNYGKYHFTGHRACKFSCSPAESAKLKGICPVCRKPLTIGVLERLEKLADREEGFKPKNAIDFKSLLPLYEIISFITETSTLYSKKVQTETDKLIQKFGSELNVLLSAEKEELIKVTSEKIAEAIINIREGKITYKPGYDGVYGEPTFEKDKPVKEEKPKRPQKTLFDFKGL
ncbi:hypothetical protein A3K63_00845 [Candidatus Micrarchaeota archaeon RBG_16_49_10]|nr:MAG: hypothetical protein A3K63_00845 [Candidatus Micrarchaeota archaeon RBG_16_49_10]